MLMYQKMSVSGYFRVRIDCRRQTGNSHVLGQKMRDAAHRHVSGWTAEWLSVLDCIRVLVDGT